MKKSTKLFSLLLILFVFNLSTKAQWELIDDELVMNMGGMSAQASNGRAVLYGGNGNVGFMPTNIYHEFIAPSTWNNGIEGSGRNQMASAALGNYLFFAGGFYEVTPSQEINIYNTTDGTWNSTDTLYVSRAAFAAAAAGTKVLYGGGRGVDDFYSIVDIYDTVTKKYTVTNLSVAREGLCAAAAGNIILFAGGSSGDGYKGDTAVYNTVDIYDITANGGAGAWVTTSNDKLSVARARPSAVAIGTKIYIAGGETGIGRSTDISRKPSDVIDIYDVVTKQWSTHTLSKPRFAMGAAATSNFIIFAGGVNNRNSNSTTKVYNTVDVYDLTNDKWTVDSLVIPVAAAGVFGLNNEFYVAGGMPQSFLGVSKIQRLKVSGLGISELDNKQQFTIYPNPATNVIELKMQDIIKEKTIIKIVNSLGQVEYKSTVQANTMNVNINVEQLSSGFYTVDLSTNKARTVRKFIKE